MIKFTPASFDLVKKQAIEDVQRLSNTCGISAELKQYLLKVVKDKFTAISNAQSFALLTSASRAVIKDGKVSFDSPGLCDVFTYLELKNELDALEEECVERDILHEIQRLKDFMYK